MSHEAAPPITVWERPADEVSSGMRVGVRAAVFQISGSDRSAVTLSIQVPGEFSQPIDGRTSATLLLSPDEALGLAAWLREAAAAATESAPPMYG